MDIPWIRIIYQDEEFEEFETLEDLEQEFEEYEEDDEDGEAVWDEEDSRPVQKSHRGLKIIAGILVVLAVTVGSGDLWLSTG